MKKNRLFDWVNQVSVKQMAVCAAILFVVSVIPLLLLGRYNVMCIDDYDYGRQVHDIWVASGSFSQAFRAAVAQMADLYMRQQGSYVSCVLMGLCPMNFKYETAFLVPIVMIVMFSLSTFVLGKQILVKWLGSSKDQASLIMFLLLFMFYQVMEAPFEGIYWYNGSVHYIIMESVLFLVIAFVSEIIWSEGTRLTVFWCLLACVGGIFVGGGNLVTGLQAEILLVLLFLYTFIMRKNRISYVIPPYLAFTLGFLCNVLAPGNTVKTSNIEADMGVTLGYSAIPAICLSFYFAAAFIIEWTNLFVILIWLALLPVFWRIGKQSDRSFKHPVWVMAGAFCVVAAMFTPTLFALGSAGLSRVDNIIQMVYYLCLFFVTIYWFGWISHQNKGEGSLSTVDKELSPGNQLGLFLNNTRNVMTAACILLVLAVWVLTADKNTYTGISALRSLVKGEAAIYYTEAMERHDMYVDETVTDVVVETFTAKPALFDFEDLSEDEGHWLNEAVTAYYHKNSVKRK